jgi:hypothetical protein
LALYRESGEVDAEPGAPPNGGPAEPSGGPGVGSGPPLVSWAFADFARHVKAQSTKDRWPFAEPKNVAVFTSTQVLRLGQPILHVSHDDGDGGWQFQTGMQQVTTGDAMIVALSEMVERDPSICELADLPCGWFAERDSIGGDWRRAQRWENRTKRRRTRRCTQQPPAFRLVSRCGLFVWFGFIFTLTYRRLCVSFFLRPLRTFMETTTLIIIVSAILVLTPLLRVLLQPRVRRTSPRKRYTVFAVLLGCGVSAQIVDAVIALVGSQYGSASLLVSTAVLLGVACVLEMQKLRREFWDDKDVV